MKLTIELPEGLQAGDTYGIENGAAKVFRSAGPSAFAGKNGCYGVAASGTITVIASTATALEIQVDAVFNQKSPLEWLGECDAPARVAEKFKATALRLDQLDAWTGRPESDTSPFDQAHPVPRR